MDEWIEEELYYARRAEMLKAMIMKTTMPNTAGYIQNILTNIISNHSAGRLGKFLFRISFFFFFDGLDALAVDAISTFGQSSKIFPNHFHFRTSENWRSRTPSHRSQQPIIHSKQHHRRQQKTTKRNTKKKKCQWNKIPSFQAASLARHVVVYSRYDFFFIELFTQRYRFRLMSSFLCGLGDVPRISELILN